MQKDFSPKDQMFFLYMCIDKLYKKNAIHLSHLLFCLLTVIHNKILKYICPRCHYIKTMCRIKQQGMWLQSQRLKGEQNIFPLYNLLPMIGFWILDTYVYVFSSHPFITFCKCITTCCRQLCSMDTFLVIWYFIVSPYWNTDRMHYLIT